MVVAARLRLLTTTLWRCGWVLVARVAMYRRRKKSVCAAATSLNSIPSNSSSQSHSLYLCMEALSANAAELCITIDDMDEVLGVDRYAAGLWTMHSGPRLTSREYSQYPGPVPHWSVSGLCQCVPGIASMGVAGRQHGRKAQTYRRRTSWYGTCFPFGPPSGTPTEVRDEMANTGRLCVVLLLAASACQGEVVLDGAGTRGPSGGGGTSSASGVSTTSSGGACVLGSESFQMELETHDKQLWSCSGIPTEPSGFTQFVGEVVESSTAGFSVELCSPAADCAEKLINTVRYAADGLQAVVPVGSFVDVSVSIDQPWGCSHAISVVNMPSWDGAANPVSVQELVWLAAADGTTAVAHSFIGIEPVPQDCPVPDVGCGDLSQAFGLRFASGAANTTPVLLPGETALWELSTQQLSIKALRAFESGCPDDYWDWAYTITQASVDP